MHVGAMQNGKYLLPVDDRVHFDRAEYTAINVIGHRRARHAGREIEDDGRRFEYGRGPAAGPVVGVAPEAIDRAAPHVESRAG